MGDISKDITSKFPNNKIKALVNIKYTANWLQNKENDFFKLYGISPQQFNILRILGDTRIPMKVQVVKDKMIDRAPNTTRLMDKLYDKKLIERARCKHDRRVVYVDISEQGQELLTIIDTTMNLDLLENLTEEEAVQLSSLLDKIR